MKLIVQGYFNWEMYAKNLKQQFFFFSKKALLARKKALILKNSFFRPTFRPEKSLYSPENSLSAQLALLRWFFVCLFNNKTLWQWERTFLAKTCLPEIDLTAIVTISYSDLFHIIFKEYVYFFRINIANIKIYTKY